MHKILFCVFINYVLIAAELEQDGSQESYRISSVSSPNDPNKPAIFSHGESPVWDGDSNSLYFVDVKKQNVHRLNYTSGMIYTKHIGYGQVNVVSLVQRSQRLLVAVRAGLYLLDWEVAGDAAIRLLTTVDNGLPDNVINEGKSDAHGRFWAGTKGPQTGNDVVPDKATFYRFSQECLVRPHIALRPVSISNGLVWSLNNTVLYYIDSPTQKVEAFDFDLYKGEISRRRTIIDITKYGFEDNAIPDGMTIDSQGNLWVAINFGGTVLHINPDTRKVIFGYKLPVSGVTSVSWGGPGLDELFVTTARDEVEPETEPAGAIFKIQNTGSKGVLPHKFMIDNADSY